MVAVVAEAFAVVLPIIVFARPRQLHILLKDKRVVTNSGTIANSATL